MNRRTFLGVAMAAATALVLPQLATQGARAGEPEVFTGLVEGVAVGGYDPVAYFSDGAPAPGDPAITATHGGATWRFSSPANRDAFLADPSRYAPRYGGYCAYAVSQGYLAKGEPEVWRIVDGKLYLNYSDQVQKVWERDIPGRIVSGDANWPRVLE